MNCVLYVTHRIQTSFIHVERCAVVLGSAQTRKMSDVNFRSFFYSIAHSQTGIKISSQASFPKRKKNDVRPQRSMEWNQKNTSHIRMMVSVCLFVCVWRESQHQIFYASKCFRNWIWWLPTFARCSGRASWYLLSIRYARIKTELPGARSCSNRHVRWDTCRHTVRFTLSDLGHGLNISRSCRWNVLTVLVVRWQEIVPASVTKTNARRRSALHVRTEINVNMTPNWQSSRQYNKKKKKEKYEYARITKNVNKIWKLKNNFANEVFRMKKKIEFTVWMINGKHDSGSRGKGSWTQTSYGNEVFFFFFTHLKGYSRTHTCKWAACKLSLRP